jgi:hypothetical protein
MLYYYDDDDDDSNLYVDLISDNKLQNVKDAKTFI